MNSTKTKISLRSLMTEDELNTIKYTENLGELAKSKNKQLKKIGIEEKNQNKKRHEKYYKLLIEKSEILSNFFNK